MTPRDRPPTMTLPISICCGVAYRNFTMIEVVAAVIQSKTEVLLARRASHKQMAGKWEFPGGKIERGESPESAIAREIREEFDIEIQVGAWICTGTHHYPDLTVKLTAYYASTQDTILSSTDHDKIVWTHPSRLAAFDIAAADIPIIEALNALSG